MGACAGLGLELARRQRGRLPALNDLAQPRSGRRRPLRFGASACALHCHWSPSNQSLLDPYRAKC